MRHRLRAAFSPDPRSRQSNRPSSGALLPGKTRPFATSVCSALKESLTLACSKFYIESKKVERPVAFEITLGPNAVGQIALSFLKSWEYGLGRAECKVDGQSRVLDGHWSRRTSLAQSVLLLLCLSGDAVDGWTQDAHHRNWTEGGDDV